MPPQAVSGPVRAWHGPKQPAMKHPAASLLPQAAAPAAPAAGAGSGRPYAPRWPAAPPHGSLPAPPGRRRAPRCSRLHAPQVAVRPHSAEAARAVLASAEQLLAGAQQPSCSPLCLHRRSLVSPKVAKNSIPLEKAFARRGLVTRPAIGKPLPHGLPAPGRVKGGR